MHLQYLDQLVNAIQHWLIIKEIDLDFADALEVIRFKLKGSDLSTYNHFRRDKGNTATFLGFMLVLCNFLTLSTYKNLL